MMTLDFFFAKLAPEHWEVVMNKVGSSKDLLNLMLTSREMKVSRRTGIYSLTSYYLVTTYTVL